LTAAGTFAKKRLFQQCTGNRPLARQRLGQAGVVVPDISNTLVGRIGFQPVRGAWLEDVGRIRIEIEPAVMVVGA
jgi:hypothetical protein